MQREIIVEGEGNVARHDEQGGDRDLLNRLRLQRGDNLAEIGIVQQPVKDNGGDSENRQTNDRADRAAAEPGIDRLR